MTDPVAYLRRTPLRRALQEAGAAWTEISGTAVATTVANRSTTEAGVSVIDLTPLPRLGFKGRGTIAAMQKRGVVVEAQPNRAFRQPDGGLCLVLAPGEVILLSNLAGDGAAFDEMAANWRLEDEERTYPLLRRDSHAWLYITGPKAPSMFAKICAIDLRPGKFSDLAIAQTSVAKLSAIVVRDADATHILADSASARYLLDCLQDAAHEFGGRLDGISRLEQRRSG